MSALYQNDMMFRDGRWIVLGSLVGSLLIAATCFGGWFTSMDMDEANWKLHAYWRFGFVFFTTFAGLFAILGSILRARRMLFYSGLMAVTSGFAVAFFPSGAQLIAGPETYIGEIESIAIPDAQQSFRILPMAGTVSSERRQPFANLTLVLEDGERKKLSVRRGDLMRELGKDAPDFLSRSRQKRKVVHLPYLNRMLSCSPE